MKGIMLISRFLERPSAASFKLSTFGKQSSMLPQQSVNLTFDKMQ